MQLKSSVKFDFCQLKIHLLIWSVHLWKKFCSIWLDYSVVPDKLNIEFFVHYEINVGS